MEFGGRILQFGHTGHRARRADGLLIPVGVIRQFSDAAVTANSLVTELLPACDPRFQVREHNRAQAPDAGMRRLQRVRGGGHGFQHGGEFAVQGALPDLPHACDDGEELRTRVGGALVVDRVHGVTDHRRRAGLGGPVTID